MEASIYDVLTEPMNDGRFREAIPDRRRLLQSVVSNLNRLFNTRRGSISHLPDYGLPDLLTVYRDAPRSVDELRSAIRKSIETYEPRLKRVRIRQRNTEAYTMRLVFIVKATLLDGEPVQFETTFESQKSTRVEPVGSYS